MSDVLILGAGASVGDGAPLQRNLIAEMLDPLNRGVLGQRQRRIREGLADLFGEQPRNAPPTLEEALGVLDLALQKQEAFKGYETTEQRAGIVRLRGDIVFGIAKVLQARLNARGTNNRALVHRLRDDGTLLQTAFVSLNYDILIDNALVEVHPDVDIDYGVDFVNFGDGPDEWKRPRLGKSVNLLKIHGSLNWLFCPACAALFITPKQKEVARLALEPIPCVRCGARMDAIVIPPSYFKTFSNVHLHRIWNVTEEVLRRADRLVFCGYSFPDADLHFKYALKRAELSRSEPWKVVVVNGPNNSGDEKARYRRFLRTKDPIFTGLTFEQFAADGLD